MPSSSAWTPSSTPTATQSTFASPSAAPERERPLEASAERRRNRVAVRLEFALPKAQPLFLIVRGPAPSCRVVGVVPIRGQAGENVVRFAGRVRERVLDPGVYLLTISPTRHLVPTAESEPVRVVSPRRTVPLPESQRGPTCSVSPLLTVARLLRAEMPSEPAAGSSVRARPAAPLRPPTNVPEEEGDSGGLPGLIPSPGALIPDADTGPIELVATFVVFALGLGLLFLVLASVARAIRGHSL